MKPETYLNACIKATEAYHKKSYDIKYLDRKLRQVRAFRDRILRMFDNVHEYYEGLLDEGDEVNRQQIRRIAQLEADNIDLSEEYAKTTRLLGEANKRIAQLEAESNKRLELLREIERDFSAVCMFCRGRLKSMGLGFEVTGHADDCQLAKELSDV